MDDNRESLKGASTRRRAWAQSRDCGSSSNDLLEVEPQSMRMNDNSGDTGGIPNKIASWLNECKTPLGASLDEQNLPNKALLKNGCSFDDDLSLGAEAKHLQASSTKAEPQSPTKEAQGKRSQYQQKSMSMNSMGSCTTVSSISELLGLYEEDPEEILYNLGFGSDEPDGTSKVPPRFLNYASCARGISITVYLNAQKQRMELENPSLAITSRFRQIEVLDTVTTAFSSLYSHVSNQPCPKANGNGEAQESPPMRKNGSVINAAKILKRGLTRLNLYTSTEGTLPHLSSARASTPPPRSEQKLATVSEETPSQHMDPKLLFPSLHLPHLLTQPRESFELEEVLSNEGDFLPTVRNNTKGSRDELLRAASLQSDSSGFAEDPPVDSSGGCMKDQEPQQVLESSDSCDSEATVTVSSGSKDLNRTLPDLGNPIYDGFTTMQLPELLVESVLPEGARSTSEDHGLVDPHPTDEVEAEARFQQVRQVWLKPEDLQWLQQNRPQKRRPMQRSSSLPLPTRLVSSMRLQLHPRRSHQATVEEEQHGDKEEESIRGHSFAHLHLPSHLSGSCSSLHSAPADWSPWPIGQQLVRTPYPTTPPQLQSFPSPQPPYYPAPLTHPPSYPAMPSQLPSYLSTHSQPPHHSSNVFSAPYCSASSTPYTSSYSSLHDVPYPTHPLPSFPQPCVATVPPTAHHSSTELLLQQALQDIRSSALNLSQMQQEEHRQTLPTHQSALQELWGTKRSLSTFRNQMLELQMTLWRKQVMLYHQLSPEDRQEVEQLQELRCAVRQELQELELQLEERLLWLEGTGRTDVCRPPLGLLWAQRSELDNPAKSFAVNVTEPVLELLREQCRLRRELGLGSRTADIFSSGSSSRSDSPVRTREHDRQRDMCQPKPALYRSSVCLTPTLPPRPGACPGPVLEEGIGEDAVSESVLQKAVESPVLQHLIEELKRSIAEEIRQQIVSELLAALPLRRSTALRQETNF